VTVDPHDAALARYHRQRLLPGIGDDGQRRLLASTALIVGVGALGTVVAESLARAGVGTLVLIDRDVVELTNLQRQTLFDQSDADAGTPKAVAAAARLPRINPGVRIIPRVEHASPRTLRAALSGHPPGVLIDCTDNFLARYTLNDLAVSSGIPLVYAGAVATRGLALTVLPGHTPCLRCLFPEPPPPGSTPTCDTAGVLAPITGLMGNIQAAEALKILLNRTDLSSPALLDIDLWPTRLRQIDVSASRDPACVCCARRTFEFLDAHHDQDAATLCGTGSVQISPSRATHIDLAALHARLTPHGDFRLTPHLLRGRLTTGIRLTVFPDARALVQGTETVDLARAVYDRYVGA
jgi:adenylyltransferase/sulfurtransferase